MSATNPKGPNYDGRRNKGISAARRQERRDQAQARQHVYDLMHPQARLAACDARPGNSTKERARLERMIEKGKV